jgi:hypothetical protein
MTLWELDRRPGRRIGANIHGVFAEIEKRNGTDEKDDEHSDGHEGDHRHDRER